MDEELHFNYLKFRSFTFSIPQAFLFLVYVYDVATAAGQEFHTSW